MSAIEELRSEIESLDPGAEEEQNSVGGPMWATDITPEEGKALEAKYGDRLSMRVWQNGDITLVDVQEDLEEYEQTQQHPTAAGSKFQPGEQAYLATDDKKVVVKVVESVAGGYKIEKPDGTQWNVSQKRLSPVTQPTASRRARLAAQVVANPVNRPNIPSYGPFIRHMKQQWQEWVRSRESHRERSCNFDLPHIGFSLGPQTQARIKNDLKWQEWANEADPNTPIMDIYADGPIESGGYLRVTYDVGS